MADEENVVGSALAIFGDDSPLRPIAEQFGKSTADSLARHGTGWFWNRVGGFWSSARQRVSKSGRKPKTPRATAAIEITKHGAAEERPDLHDAYENIAARAMTEDEREDDYEEYVHTLSQLQAGDINVLREVTKSRLSSSNPNEIAILIALPEIADRLMERPDELDEDPQLSRTRQLQKLLASFDRLQGNNLVNVRLTSSASDSPRQPGDWFVRDVATLDIGQFHLAAMPLGFDLVDHIADLEPVDEAADG